MNLPELTSNLQRIKDGEYSAEDLVALLRSRGYFRVANAVEVAATQERNKQVADWEQSVKDNPPRRVI